MGGLKGLGALFGKGGLGAAMPGLGGGGPGLPGLGGGKIPPDLQNLLNKK
jgi:signal recognition particle subunit SRP54